MAVLHLLVHLIPLSPHVTVTTLEVASSESLEDSVLWRNHRLNSGKAGLPQAEGTELREWRGSRS